jgi:hypothetical protein
MLPRQQFHIFSRNFIWQTYTKYVLQIWFSHILIHDAHAALKLSYIFCWNQYSMLPPRTVGTNLIFGHADSQPNIIYEAICCFHVIKKNHTLQILLKFGMKDFSKSSNSNSWIYWFIVKTSLLRVINGLFHMVYNPSTDLQNPVQGTVTDLHVIFFHFTRTLNKPGNITDSVH